MNEKLKAFQGKAADFFKKLNKRTRILLAAAAAAVLILLAAAAVSLSRQPYTNLMTDRKSVV